MQACTCAGAVLDDSAYLLMGREAHREAARPRSSLLMRHGARWEDACLRGRLLMGRRACVDGNWRRRGSNPQAGLGFPQVVPEEWQARGGLRHGVQQHKPSDQTLDAADPGLLEELRRPQLLQDCGLFQALVQQALADFPSLGVRSTCGPFHGLRLGGSALPAGVIERAGPHHRDPVGCLLSRVRLLHRLMGGQLLLDYLPPRLNDVPHRSPSREDELPRLCPGNNVVLGEERQHALHLADFRPAEPHGANPILELAPVKQGQELLRLQEDAGVLEIPLGGGHGAGGHGASLVQVLLVALV
mmetsp:Transcript_84772/g.252657  ORF Transcript_84772/g.252657 Transcript_84772/m.252657 type:complete len:301 (-) Transcript_84772:730-1632(-)